MNLCVMAKRFEKGTLHLQMGSETKPPVYQCRWLSTALLADSAPAGEPRVDVAIVGMVLVHEEASEAAGA